MININNYEGFYLDYLEGNLSAELVVELHQFLQENPHLKMEDDFLPILNFDANLEIDKNELHVFDESLPIDKNSIDLYLIAKLEGILSENKILELQKFLKKHPQFLKDEDIIYFTKLVPENTVYKDKKSLLKGGKVIHLIPVLKYASVAAVLVLFINLFFNENEENSNGELASTSTHYSNDEVKDSRDSKKVETLFSKQNSTSVGREKTLEYNQKIKKSQRNVGPQEPLLASSQNDVIFDNNIKKEVVVTNEDLAFEENVEKNSSSSQTTTYEGGKSVYLNEVYKEKILSKIHDFANKEKIQLKHNLLKNANKGNFKFKIGNIVEISRTSNEVASNS